MACMGISRRSFFGAALFSCIDNELLNNILEPNTTQSLDILVKINKNAEKYLLNIIDACAKVKDIYPIPPFFLGYLINIESSFDKYAFSIRGALGLGQFMLATANSYGLKTMPLQDIKKIKVMDAYWQKYQNASREFNKALKEKRFSELESLDSVLNNKKRVFFAEYEKVREFITSKLKLMDETELNNYDQRAVERIAIPATAKLLAQDSLKIEKHFGFDNPTITLLWAGAAYNAGIGRVYSYEGPPPFDETTKYVVKLMRCLGKISP